MSDKSALDKLIASTSSHWPTLTPKARAELLQLRAQVTEQARRLDEAHHVISEASDALDGAGLGGCYASQACRAWLASTAPAPAPQAEQEQTK